MKKIVILTGAGVSRESGLETFRDAGGLWEGHDVMDVASPQGWNKNMPLVLDFYNQRRKQLVEAKPNPAHKALARLEEKFNVVVITQNIDDLHERAGSSNVLHLHGELRKVQSTANPSLVYDWDKDLHVGDTCSEGSQLRPYVVWFGEPVPMMEKAVPHMLFADYFLIIGTSMVVYPAASLIEFVRGDCIIYYVDPKPNIDTHLLWNRKVEVIDKEAGEAVPKLVEELLGEG